MSALSVGPDRVPGRLEMLSVGALGGFGLALNVMLTFLVPLRARELGAGFAVAGWLVGAGAFAPLLLSIPSGAIIDRLGARRCFLVSSIGCAALIPLLGLVSPWMLLIPVQVVLGFLRSFGWVATQVYSVGRFAEAHRDQVMSRFSFFTNVGTLAGPAAVGLVATQYGLLAAFWFVACYSLAYAGLGAVLPADATAHPTRAGAGFTSARVLLGEPMIRSALALTAVRVWLSTVWMTFFPLYLIERGLSEAVTGLVLSGRGGAATLASPWAARLGARMTLARATALALASGCLGVALIPLVTNPGSGLVSAALVGIADGLSLPLLLLLVTSHTPEELRGVALGLRTTMNQFSNTIVPITAGALIAGAGSAVGFLASAGAAAVVLAGSLLVGREDHQSARDEV